MTETRVSFRYARAIIETAIQENISDVLFKDFKYVLEVIEVSKDFKTFIRSPLIHENTKIKVIDELLPGKVSELTMTFLHFLVKKGRADLIIDIIAQYEKLYNIHNKRIKVDATSAIELNDEAKAKIVKTIEEYTKQTVLPNFMVQKDIKGGLLVRIEDWVFDGTLKSQLVNLFNKLSRN